MTPSARLDAAVALTRFGLGARPGEIAAVGNDARDWLQAQVTPGGAPVPAGDFETTDQRLGRYQAYQAEAAQARRLRTAPADRIRQIILHGSCVRHSSQRQYGARGTEHLRPRIHGLSGVATSPRVARGETRAAS